MTGSTNRRKPAIRKPAIPRNASRRCLELLEDLATLAHDVLTRHGMDSTEARAAAAAIARELGRQWGGQQLYIPRPEYQAALAQRDAELLERFDGTNRDELCREYRITIRHFYNLLAAQQGRATNRRGGQAPR